MWSGMCIIDRGVGGVRNVCSVGNVGNVGRVGDVLGSVRSMGRVVGDMGGNVGRWVGGSVDGGMGRSGVGGLGGSMVGHVLCLAGTCNPSHFCLAGCTPRA